MKCESCNGSGDGLKKGDGKCSACNGTGTRCDTCGESCETGADTCDQCKSEECEES